MKRSFLLAAAICVAHPLCMAQSEQGDSLTMVSLQDIQVVSTRAGDRTPVAYSSLYKATIRSLNTGVDLPFLLQMTPSAVATSDAGGGIGYTSVRIRGTDASRINVTANGIPMNDAESHSMFWVNTPDFVSSTADIQIVRGAGTSTNGAGAFGASINIKTDALEKAPHGAVSASYGSFNSHRESVSIGTGLVGKGRRWAFNARLSNIGSDGYIDRASTRLKSYFLQGGYYTKRSSIKFINFAGQERTYHAWSGQTAQEMAERGRRYNPCGEIEDAAGNVAGFYKDQIDRYTLSNYHLLFSHQFSPVWSMNFNLHYYNGDGYYEEYKNRASLEEYELKPFDVVVGGVAQTVTESNLVRRKGMNNWFGGGVFSVNYESKCLSMSLGGASNVYDGDHAGRVMWLKEYSGDNTFRPEHLYYKNNGRKSDTNVYLKANWMITNALSLFGDVQYRHIGYRIEGSGDNRNWNTGIRQKLDVDKSYDFFNPKFGGMYRLSPSLRAFASIAVAHREPTRNNFTDAIAGAEPKPERLTDYEAGVNYSHGILVINVNLYYMRYKDQLILSGKVNEIGEPLANNIPKSYRMGIELSVGVTPTRWLTWETNVTLSRNRVNNHTEYLDDTDALGGYIQRAEYLGSRDISFSPEVVAGSLVSANHRGWSLGLHTIYVSKQYLNNSQSEALKLDGYLLNNLRAGYEFQRGVLRGVSLGVAVNNVFDTRYSSNGYGGSYYTSTNHSLPSRDSERHNWAYYFPQAGANVMGSVVIAF